MTTHKDYLEHKKQSSEAVSSCYIDQAKHDEIERHVQEFLEKGKEIKVLEGAERMHDGSKPLMTINAKKMSERENKEFLKKQACSFYANGKAL